MDGAQQLRSGFGAGTPRDTRAVRRAVRTLAVTGVVGTVAAAGMGLPASAEGEADHYVVVSKDQSKVSFSGAADGVAVTVDVLRGGVTIGTATGTTATTAEGIEGAFEVNYESATVACWDDSLGTPALSAGDLVRVTTASAGATAVAAEMHVGDITVTEGPTTVTGSDTVTVKGIVHADPRPALDDLTVFLRGSGQNPFDGIAPDRSDGHTLAYDSPDGGAFTASFTVPASVAASLAEPEVVASYSAGDSQVTDAVLGAEAAPVGDCPGVPERTLTGVTPGVLNDATKAGGVTVSGATQGARAVTVTLRDEAAHVISKDVPTTGDEQQDWTVRFATEELATLSGTITATARHALPTGLLAGDGSGTFVKEPLSPVGGDTGGGTGGGGSTPPAQPPVAEPPVAEPPVIEPPVAEPPAVEPPVVEPPVATTRPSAPRIARTIPGRPGGRSTAGVRWVRPADNGGARITSYVVRALRIRSDGTVATRRVNVELPAQTRSVRMELPRGRYRFRVRAVSSVGTSAWSRLSRTVRSR